MRSSRTIVVSMAMLPLFALGLSGCQRKAPPPPPPAATAPPLPPSSMTQTPTVPKMPPPAQPQVGAPGSDEKPKETEPVPVRHPRRTKKKPVQPASADVATSSSPVVTPPAGPPATPAASAPEPSLGQLAPGTGADIHDRASTVEQIHAQEVRLSKIKHPLSEEDKAITQQVQAFLSKARQAVSENDLDGAQTLTTKAKVLLDELTQS